MTKILYNSLTSSDLSVAALWGPSNVLNITANQVQVPGGPPAAQHALVHAVAEQINTSRMSFQPSFRAVDLEQMIGDVLIETSAQGASLLEVHVIDPYWALLRRNSSGWCFIDVDPEGSGFLWPPIEVNFPPSNSDATWRLVQVKPSTSLDEANIVLVFEDKIVSEMREHAATGPDPTDPSLASSHANETRAQFIRRCVETVGQHPLLPGEVNIRFWPLLVGSDFTSADLIGSELTLPSSATQPNAPPQRQNFTKSPNVNSTSTPSPHTSAFTRSRLQALRTVATAKPTEVNLNEGTVGNTTVTDSQGQLYTQVGTVG